MTLNDRRRNLEESTYSIDSRRSEGNPLKGKLAKRDFDLGPSLTLYQAWMHKRFLTF